MQMIALHKNGLDVFSVLCYFYAMILPALQAIVEQQLFLRQSCHTMLCFDK